MKIENSTKSQSSAENISEKKEILEAITKRWYNGTEKCASEAMLARAIRIKEDAARTALTGAVLGVLLGGPPAAPVGATLGFCLTFIPRASSSINDHEWEELFSSYVYPCLHKRANLDDKPVEVKMSHTKYQISPDCVMDFGLSDYKIARCIDFPSTRKNEDSLCDERIRDIWNKCASSTVP